MHQMFIGGSEVAGTGPARGGHHHVVEPAVRMDGPARNQRVAR